MRTIDKKHTVQIKKNTRGEQVKAHGVLKKIDSFPYYEWTKPLKNKVGNA